MIKTITLCRSPSDEREEQVTSRAHILNSGTAGPDLAAENVVEYLSYVLLGLGEREKWVIMIH